MADRGHSKTINDTKLDANVSYSLAQVVTFLECAPRKVRTSTIYVDELQTMEDSDGVPKKSLAACESMAA